MKNLYRLMLLLCIVVATSATAWGTQNNSLKGRIVNSKGEPVGYATVVVMAAERQVAGTTTDENGTFSLSLATGEYSLVVEFVGYKSIHQKIKVAETIDLGNIVMHEASTSIDEVVVSAQMIRREADRFVVDVANSASAIGKDGEELLRQSPGVWIEDDNISVNGATGTKLYINEREMKLSGADLVNYIRTLKAEDIAKIEIVPQTGADHDANTSGGAIKITLRRKLDNGVMGSVGIYGNQGKYGNDYNPYARINANIGKFTLGGGIGYYFGKHKFLAAETTDYPLTGSKMASSSDQDMTSDNPGIDLSAVWEISPKHSIGLSYDWYGSHGTEYNNSSTRFLSPLGERLSKSTYDALDGYDFHSASLNYIFKTDTLGSVVKLLADYTSRAGRNSHDNLTHITDAEIEKDSLYNDCTNTLFRVATASLAREKVFSKQ